MHPLNVAIAGATGVVGEQMRQILEDRDLDVSSLRLFASERSEGKRLTWKRAGIDVEVLGSESFKGIDIALFSAGSEASKIYAPAARDAGAVVIDNSNAWRMDPDVPLVVPEVNPAALASHRGIIANPNCSTIQMVVALKPLHDRWGLKRVVVSTYQAVSGTGQKAVEELLSQSQAFLSGGTIDRQVYPHQIAFNILPHIDVLGEDGYSKEEKKMINETRKILDIPDLPITATTVRVPVVTGHSESINVEFVEPMEIEEVRKVLGEAQGVTVVDDPLEAKYPMPLDVTGTDSCYVGRIRRDDSVVSGINLWVVADNLRKGAALNAIQIAENLINNNLIKQKLK